MIHDQKIAFIQHRPIPKVDGRIQSFRWQFWRSEFSQAEKLSIGLIERTLYQDRLYENPLLTVDRHKENFTVLC